MKSHMFVMFAGRASVPRARWILIGGFTLVKSLINAKCAESDSLLAPISTITEWHTLRWVVCLSAWGLYLARLTFAFCSSSWILYIPILTIMMIVQTKWLFPKRPIIKKYKKLLDISIITILCPHWTSQNHQKPIKLFIANSIILEFKIPS